MEKPPPPAEEVEGWWLFKTLKDDVRVEKRENTTRLVAKGTAPVILEAPPGWDAIVDLVLSPDGPAAHPGWLWRRHGPAMMPLGL